MFFILIIHFVFRLLNFQSNQRRTSLSLNSGSEDEGSIPKVGGRGAGGTRGGRGRGVGRGGGRGGRGRGASASASAPTAVKKA